LHLDVEAVLRPEVPGEPLDCRLKTKLVKYREARSKVKDLVS
jgi:hypothetical protein